MIFAHLTRQWLARRGQASFPSWFLDILRSLHVPGWDPDQHALRDLGIVRKYLAKPGSGDPFHRLGQHEHLARGWNARQRVQAVLSHYRYEENSFDDTYLQAVYGERRLPLWQHEAEGNRFEIRLEAAARSNAEGDLTVALVADGTCLHRLSYSWIDGRLVGVDLPVVPFIARNEGRWADAGPAFEAFERAFPNNSPSFFCFAAMQGIVQAAGIDKVVAIRSESHIAYDPDPDKHFANAYDGFWKILGGVEMLGQVGYLIALPFYVKPLADMPSKHRKRAAQRREHWRLIGESARAVLLAHLLNAPAHVEHSAEQFEPA